MLPPNYDLELQVANSWCNSMRVIPLKSTLPNIGFTNGCFDILHIGHVRYLQQCRRECNWLMVGINSDLTIRELKGEGRPINNEFDRCSIIRTLKPVDYAFVFNSTDVCRVLATIRPDIWFKGGDYTIQTLNQREVAVAQAQRTIVRIVPATEAVSTSKLVERIRKDPSPQPTGVC